MPISYPIAPWLGTPADPAAHYASGMQIGIRLGAEQAANIYRQQQMQREAQHEALQAAQYQQQLQRELQKDAFDVAYKDQARQLEIDQITRKHRAVANYQSMISSGVDPMQALMSVGPDMGVSPLEVEKINAVNQFKATEEARRRASAASLQSHRKFLEDARTRGDEATAAFREKLLKLRESAQSGVQGRFDTRMANRPIPAAVQKEISSLDDDIRTAKRNLESEKAKNPFFGKEAHQKTIAGMEDYLKTLQEDRARLMPTTQAVPAETPQTTSGVASPDAAQVTQDQGSAAQPSPAGARYSFKDGQFFDQSGNPLVPPDTNEAMTDNAGSDVEEDMAIQ